jgi:hypothetical protein
MLLTLLVVDDHLRLRDGARQLLEGQSYRVGGAFALTPPRKLGPERLSREAIRALP